MPLRRETCGVTALGRFQSQIPNQDRHSQDTFEGTVTPLVWLLLGEMSVYSHAQSFDHSLTETVHVQYCPPEDLNFLGIRKALWTLVDNFLSFASEQVPLPGQGALFLLETNL